MTDLMLWEPVTEGMMSLRKAMDRLFESSFVRPIFPELFGASPALDMYETDNDVVIKATVPGVKPEDLHVTVTGNTLTIKGEVKAEEDVEKRSYVYRERRYGQFVRSVALPSEVEADKAKAEFEHGVLTLTIPKKETVKPKTIPVKAK